MQLREARATKLVVVVVGRSLAALELIESALRESGHRTLTTTKPEEVVELSQSIRIDVLVGDHSDALDALEEEVRLIQPDVRMLRICDPDELQRIDIDGTSIARPLSLQELECVVSDVAARPEQRA